MLRMAPLYLLAVTAMTSPVSAFGMYETRISSCRTTKSWQPSSHSESVQEKLRHRKATQNEPCYIYQKASSRAVIMAMSPSNMFQVRGGATGSVATLLQSVQNWNATPANLFNMSFLAVALLTAALKIFQRTSSNNAQNQNGDKVQVTVENNNKPTSIKDLQIKFLAVFWLLRCADWLQGPYFYEVYANKVFDGVPASIALISRLFLTGFASTALFGPVVGRAVDVYGRKRGTLAFSLIYAIGAFSTRSPILAILVLGRIFSGIGTSLLFSAPESWLVGEAQRSGDDPDGKYLGETFGLAYAGDSVVAILAGQLAGFAASQRGPTGPFELSTGFLAIGGLLTACLWTENVATTNKDSNNGESGQPSIRDAIRVVKEDPKIMLVGGVQSLFEAAMYIFVLQWPPAISSAVTTAFGEGAATPFGTVFSCFMACCLFGSSLFGLLSKIGVPTESFTAAMLLVGTIAMSAAAYTVSAAVLPSLSMLVASFFAFEACVGMYFPAIGTLRSKYVPDSHRSVIMNLFGIPLNVLVVSVFLSISKLGVGGALKISAGALALATTCMVKLNMRVRSSNHDGQPAA